jgi:hypothetical protein
MMAKKIVAQSRQIYLHRWKDGTFSVVVADDSIKAAMLLDEVGQVDPEDLIVIDKFMATFCPKPARDEEESPIWELEDFGWNTETEITQHTGSAAENLEHNERWNRELDLAPLVEEGDEP